jgi:hypothetical protein
LPVCVAVTVDPCVAESVKVVVSGVVCTNVPVTVPDVNGVVRLVGDEMPSVLVIFALAGVVEYVAANGGLTTDAPTGTVHPPVKLVMAKTAESEIVMVFPPLGVHVNPVAQAIVNAPVSVLREVTPLAGTEQVCVPVAIEQFTPAPLRTTGSAEPFTVGTPEVPLLPVVEKSYGPNVP